MTCNRIVFGESDYAKLSELMASGGLNEAAAFLLCRESVSENGVALIVRDVIAIDPAHIIAASPTGMSISSRAVARALKVASDQNSSFVFVHSHPRGMPSFSAQDDTEDEKLFATAHVRASGVRYHASMIWSGDRLTAGRLWTEALIFKPLVSVNIIGLRFRFYRMGVSALPSDLFDRQVRAFGSEIQTVLQSLHVGIVGVGGTGSAVLEQLVRLGVGAISIYDGDLFERSNVNRVYGSSPADQGLPKVTIAERLIRSIGLGTEIRVFHGDIGREELAATLRDCDIIFGCTDDELGRSILSRLALSYRIPVFDMGVKVDPIGEKINSIEGRVTTLMPGEACLLCRGRITGAGIAADSLRKFQPDQADQLERDGYLGRAGPAAPSVVTFTTLIAATAVTELLQRLTGMSGEDRASSEVLFFMHDGRIRTNRKEGREGCFCGNQEFVASADRKPFLDMVWPQP